MSNLLEGPFVASALHRHRHKIVDSLLSPLAALAAGIAPSRAGGTAPAADGALAGAPSVATERGDPRPPYERGNALLFAGDAEGAIAAYRDAVRDAPADPIGYRGLGLAYEQKGETASAIRALHKYLKLAPHAADRAIISRRIDRLSKNAGAK